LATTAHLLLYFVPASNLIGVFGTLALGAVGFMLAMIVMWALEGDTVEYGEWRSGVRIEGLNYSVFSFTRKCGQALGGSIPAFLLAASAYVPNVAVQSPTVVRTIQQGVALVPAIAFAVAFLIMLFYPLSDRRFLELVEEIKMRRQQS
ncbi:MAG: sugar (Glycoside-Pentoside-Hexuronide) transporter, partial [Proteobacteria bacterium]|nr:sugar (Glycoside-Pentoside-Hexuronide) transporter [Pseudomonadota bacterium]